MSNEPPVSSQPTRHAALTLAGRMNLPDFEPGWVWLVGAGPGDPGLISLHALNALEQADAVVYDALVSEDILQLARSDAEFIYAGKRGGKPSTKQQDISSTLVELAQAGKRVLRLKGGDPFTFGRGGEEALVLVEAGIPFRLVPGITAGIGGLGYAGIPITHRDTNHAVTFITGHVAGGNVPTNIDWTAIAKGSQTVVLYMSLKQIGTIAEHFMAVGRAKDEPVAVVSKASTPEQFVLESDLAGVAAAVAAADIAPPAVIVIGEVVRLRAGLDWLGAISDGRKLNPHPLD